MRLGATPRQVDAALATLSSARRVVRYDQESGAMVHAEELARLRALAREHVATFHRQNPLREGLPREELRQRLPGGVSPRLLHVVLEGLVTEGALAVDRDLVRERAHSVAAAPQAGVRERLLTIYEQAGLAPPRNVELPELARATAKDVGDVLALLEREGTLVRVSAELHFARTAIDDLRARLLAHLTAQGEIDAQRFKELVGQSRKFSIPLGEYFDSQKLTMRVGEVRKLRGR
jgi:selenocysteine-specific elongation factor